MSIFVRGKHDRRRVPAQTAPPPPARPAEPPYERARTPETMPFPAAIVRPYAAQPAGPLTAPDIEITETAVIGHQLSESPVREAVWLTHRASNFRFPVRCLCGGEHHNLNADTFADLYASARKAGWQEDQFRTWRCHRCVRQLEALRRAPRVAAIEAGAA
jgi:hypothetical protein